MRGKKPILLVEDDHVDGMTVQRALKDLHITNRLDMAYNGEEALEILRDDKRERPCIILLDLNMPKMNGIEFLKVVKNDDAVKKIPVVVLTTSTEEQDKVESYNHGIAGYMIKPVDYKQFVETMKTIHMYWILSELPA